ncbi:unnamed protein product, partial [Prorocentrum cordatum]
MVATAKPKPRGGGPKKPARDNLKKDKRKTDAQHENDMQRLRWKLNQAKPEVKKFYKMQSRQEKLKFMERFQKE